MKEKEIIHKDTSNNYISITYKIKKPKIDEYLLRVYLNAILRLKFGPLTKIYNSTYQDSNYVSDIDYGVTLIDDYALICLM